MRDKVQEFKFTSRVDCGSLNRLFKMKPDQLQITMNDNKTKMLLEMLAGLERLPKIETPVSVSINTCGRKRDIDNFSSAFVKVMLDALVMGGAIPDDTVEFVQRITIDFRPDLTHDTEVIVRTMPDGKYVKPVKKKKRKK